MSLKLVIGNKNYSSWSMRPWLALRASDIAFEEIFIPLYTGDADKQRILDFTEDVDDAGEHDADDHAVDPGIAHEEADERLPQRARHERDGDQ